MLTNPITRDVRGRRFTVTMTAEGWAVREEQGDRVVRAVTYTDWHRVERAMEMFERTSNVLSAGDELVPRH